MFLAFLEQTFGRHVRDATVRPSNNAGGYGGIHEDDARELRTSLEGRGKIENKGQEQWR